ncbi:MAG: hypothetical protein ACRDO7_15025, partial [Nocardioidaceae bacterium]
SYAGLPTGVSVEEIPAAAPSMRVRLGVRTGDEQPTGLKRWRADVVDRIEALEKAVRNLSGRQG